MVCLVYIVHKLCVSVWAPRSGLKASNEIPVAPSIANEKWAEYTDNEPWLGKTQSAQLPDSGLTHSAERIRNKTFSLFFIAQTSNEKIQQTPAPWLFSLII